MNCPYCNNQTAGDAKLCAHCGKNVHERISKNRKRSIKCPTCKVPTSILRLVGVELDFCHECSGIWFDKKEMEQFQQSITQEHIAEEISSLLSEMALGKVRHKRGVYIECPICKDMMVQRNYEDISGIILDQCLRHGTWADKQDLIKIFDLITTGDIDELIDKASKKRYRDLEKKVMDLKNEQTFLKADLARTRRNHKAHLVLDIFGLL